MQTLRRLTRALVLATMLVGTAFAQGTTLTILSVNDTHSHLDAVGPKDANLDGTIGGLVKASAVLAELGVAEPNTLFLHAGDLFMGDSYFNATVGSTELQLLGLLGLDAMTLGNHELWLPPAMALAPAYQVAFPAGGGFPILGANVAGPSLPFLVPSVMREVAGVKVGIFGLVTPGDLIAGQNADILGADPDELVRIATEQVQQLRTEEARVVILLSHLGIDLDRYIAAQVPGIDLIVGGHDHASIVMVENEVPIVHAGAHYRQVGEVRLSVNGPDVSVASVELVEVDQKVRRPLPSESPIAAAVAQVQGAVMLRFAGILDPARYGDFFHTKLATAAGRISNAIDLDRPKRDSGTGNLVTDALRWRTGTDVAFTVAGQTPEGIAEGPIVGEDLFRVVGLGFDAETGFDWRIATLSIQGADLWNAIEGTIAQSLVDDDYILQVSGMKYVYDSSRNLGERLRSVTIGGEPLDPSRTYTATVNALLWEMLPRFGIPQDGELLEDYEFTALRDYVIALGTVDSAGSNRARDLAARGRRWR